VELGGAQRRPWQARLGHDLLGRPLGGEVAEHGAVDAADDGDALGPDDGDVDDVRSPRARRGAEKAGGLVLVALAAAGEVHDDLGSLHGGLDPLAGGEVAADVLDAVRGLAGAPAEHADLAAGVAQARDDEPAERARAAGDEDGVHACASMLL
jgi:hypothetical protein